MEHLPLDPAGALAGTTIAPGVYLGMPPHEYHAAPALGSTDIRLLRQSPPDWWWQRFRAPATPPPPAIARGDPMEIGAAAHALIVEGDDAFRARYALRPPDTARMTRAKAAAAAEDARRLMWQDDWDRCHLARDAIASHQVLSRAFRGGVPEASVFWHEDVHGRTVHRKARIDYLRRGVVVELKTIRHNSRGALADACRRRIADSRYDIQAATYLQAIRAARQHAAAGRVYGDGADTVCALLAPVQWSHVWIFAAMDGAPDAWGCWLGDTSPIIQQAERDVHDALRNYLVWLERYGLDTPWRSLEPFDELTADALPSWMWR